MIIHVFQIRVFLFIKIESIYTFSVKNSLKLTNNHHILWLYTKEICKRSRRTASQFLALVVSLHKLKIIWFISETDLSTLSHPTQADQVKDTDSSLSCYCKWAHYTWTLAAKMFFKKSEVARPVTPMEFYSFHKYFAVLKGFPHLSLSFVTVKDF